MKRTSVVLLATALTLTGCGSLSSSTGTGATVGTATKSQEPASEESPAPEDTPTPEDTGSPLTAKSVTLAVKITSKQCFGSAGCNVDYRVKPATSASKPFDGTYEVTFTIRGDESGPITGSFTVAEDGSIDDASDLEGFLSTKRASTKVTAVVNSVEKV